MDHSLCVAALRSYKVDLESELATSPAQGLTETETANHKVVIQDLNRLIACYEGQSRREDSLFTSSDESASDSITDEVESTRNEVAGQAASSSATTASQRAESVHSDQASSGDEDGSYSGTSVKRRVYQARLFFPESDDHGSTIDAKIEQVSSEEGNSTSEDNARESKNDHTTRSGVQALTQFDMYKYGIDENDGVYALGRPPKRSNYFKDVFFRLDRIHVSLGFKTPQKSALMV